MTDLVALVELFHPSLDALGVFAEVSAGDLPDIYHVMLAHHDHMTVTVEAWHNSLVDVRVLHEQHCGDSYAREILLLRQRDGRPVQYGIMQIDLNGLPEIVRTEICSQALPLGRILIRRHVLRQVELTKLWRVRPAAVLRRHLQLAQDAEVFGRTARILVEGRPAVQLLEVVTM